MGITQYVYDANISMISRGEQTRSWDVENRPVAISGLDNTATFVYDAM